MASARARSRSPLITHGEQWVTRYYCSLKLGLDVAGRRVNSREFVRWGDRASWQEEARQRSPSSLITSLIKCVEGKCHEDLERARSAAQPADLWVGGWSHQEFGRCAHCLLAKLIPEHPANLSEVHDIFCEALDDVHAYSIQRSIWNHILNEMVESGPDRLEWEFRDAGQRNAAVDCVEKNMQRVQDSLDWCRAMLLALKEPVLGGEFPVWARPLVLA